VSDARWHILISDFVECRIDERAFHDRFFDFWNAISKARGNVPPAIETLFYVVEAYCPDPALRDPASPYEADDAELRQAAGTALAALARPSRIMTFLSRMKP
jgi:hypothetical protein